MASRTVKSPAGEMIEIVPDEDWLTLTGVNEQSMRMWNQGTKRHIIRSLWEHGKFTDTSGRATGKLVEYANANHGMDFHGAASAISSLLLTPVNSPAFERQIKGKRTYAIRLIAMPELWYIKLGRDIAADTPEPEAIPEPAPGDRAAAEQMEKVIMPQDNGDQGFTDVDWSNLQLDAPTVYEQPPPLELHMANQVAMSLLTTVVEIITAGHADTSALSGARQVTEELEHAQHLLSQRLMENDKLRRQLREAGDAISALRVERDGLRSRLRSTEYNLTQVLKGETAAAVNSEITKRVDQIMRTAPTTKGD